MIKGGVCGICAREMIAAIHGNPRHQLRGMAEDMRLQAVEWRRAHPLRAPVRLPKSTR